MVVVSAMNYSSDSLLTVTLIAAAEETSLLYLQLPPVYTEDMQRVRCVGVDAFRI